MKKITEALPIEISAIKHWAIYDMNQKIRNSFTGRETDLVAIHDAEVIKRMFKEYDSELNKSETIYRGIKFKKSNSAKMITFSQIIKSHKEAMNSNTATMIDIAPASFSRDSEVAMKEFAFTDKKAYKSIVYKLIKRESNELDIKSYAGKFAYQKEVIIRSHESKYIIESIENLNENGFYDTILITIKEITDESN